MAANEKFCPSCGSPNELDGVFCTNCGSKLTAVSAAAEAPAASTPAASMPPLPQGNRSDFITLSCPNCGGRLQITPDVERFACQFCGYEHIVRRSGGIVSLEPVMKMMGQLNNTIGYVGAGMNRLGFNTEKQAAEVTIKRLKEEIAELQTSLANFRQGSDNVLVFGGIFLSIAGAAILCGFMGLYNIGIGFLVAAICVPIGIIIMSSSKNSGAKQKAALQQQITEKEAELQRNYDFVNRFQ
jgi:hypothetical protein